MYPTLTRFIMQAIHVELNCANLHRNILKKQRSYGFEYIPIKSNLNTTLNSNSRDRCLPSCKWTCCSIVCNRSFSSLFSAVRPFVSLCSIIQACMVRNARHQIVQNREERYTNTHKYWTHSIINKVMGCDVLMYLQEGQLSRQRSCFCLQCLHFSLKLCNVSHLPFLWSSSRLPVCPDPVTWSKKRKY